MIVIAVYLICALFAPWIAPYGEAEIVGNAYQPSSAQFWLGTDQIGRDIFSRLIYGARNTIGIALVTTLLSFAVGGTLGVFAAINRGWLDQILSRLVDALMSIPTLIFSLMLLAVFGKYISALILILALLDFDPCLPAGARHGHQCGGDGLCRGGEIARRGPRLDHDARNRSQHHAAFGRRIRPALLLRVPDHQFAVVLGRRHPAADRRLGLDGRREQDADHLWQPDPTLSCRGAIALLTVAVNFVVDWFLHRTSGLRDEH